jgi:UDP-N-acetylmuramoyl-tripeptide--D-alanyl-D-alanine ligase
VANALAAAAAAIPLGVTPEAVAAGLSGAEISGLRMQLERTASGALILNDAYNANPTSMAAALDALVALPAARRTAVLGVMAELGPDGDAAHRAVAVRAAALGVRVIAVDAPAYGPDAIHVAGVEAAVDALGELAEGDAVVVKGSRVAALERVAAALLSS